MSEVLSTERTILKDSHIATLPMHSNIGFYFCYFNVFAFSLLTSKSDDFSSEVSDKVYSLGDIW